MSEKESRKDRAEKIVKDLIENGWSQVLVGSTVVYQKPAPMVEHEELQEKVQKKERRTRERR